MPRHGTGVASHFAPRFATSSTTWTHSKRTARVTSWLRCRSISPEWLAVQHQVFFNSPLRWHAAPLSRIYSRAASVPTPVYVMPLKDFRAASNAGIYMDYGICTCMRLHPLRQPAPHLHMLSDLLHCNCALPGPRGPNYLWGTS